MKYVIKRTLRKDVSIQNMLLESKKIVLTILLENGKVIDEQVEEYLATLPPDITLPRIPAVNDKSIDFSYFDLNKKRNIKINIKEDIEIIPKI